MNPSRPVVFVLALTTLALAGCRVSNDKNGKNDNVEISSPFGGVHIKTSDASDTSAIGLTAYPGATPWKDDNDKDNQSADINLSFGDFHVGVKAASFRSTDPQDKILAFYKKDLAKYGEVLTCKGNDTVGTPTRTSLGLTCSDDDNKKTRVSTDTHENLELRAGSPTHQHIVGVEQKDGATKIGLVALDLPSHLGSHKDTDSE